MNNRSSFIFIGFLVVLIGIPSIALASTPTAFVPLTDIPVFSDAAKAGSLPNFFNALYKITIGIAVVLTVLQLVRGGVMYTMGDSGFAKIEEAKHIITTALLGLLLVLSPYIVFTVINPNILNLNIDAGGLTPTGTQPAQTQSQQNADALASSTPLKQGDTLLKCDAASCDPQIAQCEKTPGGADANHVCADAQGNNVTETNFLGGYKCSYGTYNYISCTPKVKSSQACPANDLKSCPTIQCPAGTSQQNWCIDKNSSSPLRPLAIPPACAGATYVLTAECQ